MNENSATASGTAAVASPQAGQRRILVPRVDVVEDESGITILADMPGVTHDRLEVRLEGEALVMEAPLQPLMTELQQLVYAEVQATHYRRSFTLSRELDASRTDATLKDGVLTLRVPKQETAQPRRVTVQVG
jgi:HSP20 family molecular chaperone IbpA